MWISTWCFHTTDMHPLFVPESLDSILNYISISPSECPMTLEERRTLVALARACSTFSEPSLDCLGRCLYSLLPLVRSFADVVDNDRVEVKLDYLPRLLWFIHCVRRPLHPSGTVDHQLVLSSHPETLFRRRSFILALFAMHATRPA